jgi:hypothetical protein
VLQNRGFLGDASRHGQVLIDRALCPPEAGVQDPTRRDAAGVPENTVFTSKPALGRRMLARACAAGAMPMGDRRRVYGADDVLRRCIERGDRSYVLA